MCGRGERLALALARENINSLMEGSSQARVEVDVYELQKDSQYDTTDTSKTPPSPHRSQQNLYLKRRVNKAARTCSVKSSAPEGKQVIKRCSPVHSEGTASPLL